MTTHESIFARLVLLGVAADVARVPDFIIDPPAAAVKYGAHQCDTHANDPDEAEDGSDADRAGIIQDVESEEIPEAHYKYDEQHHASDRVGHDPGDFAVLHRP